MFLQIFLSAITFLVFTGFFFLLDVILLPFALDAIKLMTKTPKEDKEKND